MLLELESVVVKYGNIEAVRGINLHVEEGEIVTLIGGNGAGKTTTLKTISGIRSPSDGVITFAGKRIDGMGAHRVVEQGVIHVPEGRHIFPRMSVRENLEMGAFLRRDAAAVKDDIEAVLDLFPVLRERFKQHGGTLSGGEQQMLAIGRAMMSRPRLLMLDEPSMGLAPLVVEKIFQTISKINESGTTILLVEQNAYVALNLADRGYVIESGEIVLTDTGEALLKSERVKKAYLGED